VQVPPEVTAKGRRNGNPRCGMKAVGIGPGPGDAKYGFKMASIVGVWAVVHRDGS